MAYYDESGNDSFFTHQKSWVPKDGGGWVDVAGPAIYVDGNYVGSADDELAWPGATEGGNDTEAYSYTKNDSWVGNTYEKTYNGVTYRVRFYDPYEKPTDRYRIHMRVYISHMEIGSRHTINIHGYWKINKDRTYEINHTMTTDAVPYPWGNTVPTANMTGINTVSVTGPLNSSYPTFIGFNSTSEGEASGGYVDTPEGKQKFESQSTFTKTGTHNRSNAHQYDGSKMGVEYLTSREDNGFTTNFYKWYNITVPGFVKPYDLQADEFVWDKAIKLTWKKENSNNRSDKGKWRIFRDGTQIADVDYSKTEYTDNVPDYDKEYTYVVAFVPDGSQSGTYISQLSVSKKKSLNRNWSITSFKGELVDDDTHINLTWSHTTIGNASSQNSYELKLERKDLSQTSSKWEPIKTFTISSSSIKNGSYLDKDGLISNHTYQYRLLITLLEKDFEYSIDGIRLGGSTLMDFAATRGTYSNMVKLSWTVKQVGVNETSFILYRRPLGSEDEKDWKQIYTTSGTGSNYSYDDNTVLTGTFNEYKVSIVGMEGNVLKSYSSMYTDGFTFATGVVSGRITYGTGTAVDSVKVTLKQQNAEGEEAASGMSSLRFTGEGAGMAYRTDNAEIQELFGGDFSVQLFVKPVREEMASNNQDYLLFDAVNVFTVRLWYNSADSTFTVGGWMTANEKTSIKIKSNEWSQLTFVHSHANKKTYVYVATADTLMKATILSGKQVEWTGNALKANTVAIGNGGSMTNANNYRGYVDEFRFFTKALTEGEIMRNLNHPLAGNEAGLAIYYPFDEGLGQQKIAYDYSKTNGVANGRHATNDDVPATSYDDVLPNPEQLSLMAYTDTLGNYTIRGVYFKGEGTAYSIIPSLGIHEFSPSASSRFVSQSSLIHSGVDFEDISSFPVSGKVFYDGTDYPVEGVTFYVDGTICSKDGKMIETNSDGEFTISVPIGDHFIRIEKNGHEFANGGRFPPDPNNTGTRYPFKEEKKNMEFQDITLVNFTGHVVGGDIEGNKQTGFGLSKNNIGVAELVLSATNDSYRLNVLKDVTGTTLDYKNNPDNVVVASDTSIINSTSWRTGGLTKADCQRIIIHTDPLTGEFSAMVPPLMYKVDAIKLVNNPDLEVGPSVSIDLSDPNKTQTDTLYSEDNSYSTYKYNTILQQTYHSKPIFNVSQEDREDGGFGISEYTIEDAQGELTLTDFYDVSTGTYTHGAPVFIGMNPYVFNLEGYEEYVNADTGELDKVPLSEVVVTIVNALSSEQEVCGLENPDYEPGSVPNLAENQLMLDQDGKATYKWKAGLPNITYPHKRTLNIYYNIGGVDYSWMEVPMEGIVLGSLPTGNNFVTSGPDMLDMILRDPPGTGSSAEWTTGTVKSKTKAQGGTWTSDNSVKTTTHLGVEAVTATGLGMWVIQEVAAKNDLTIGIKASCSGEDIYGWSREVTTTKTITTSDDPSYVGADGDVFIGSATNIIFGKARNLDLYRSETDTKKAELKLNDVITTGLSFGTEFSYTQSYIENSLIPNFVAMRNSKLEKVTTIEGFKNDQNRVRYVTTLNEDDPKYGSSNNDQTVWGNLAAKKVSSEGPSYYMFEPANAKDDEVFEDSLEWCNNQIRIWQSYLALNEAEKVQAFEQRGDSAQNYSFDAGSTVTNSHEVTEAKTNTYDVNVTAVAIVGTKFGASYNKVGTEWEFETETGGGSHITTESSDATTVSFNYTLKEEGSDALTVDVYQYGSFSPIFRTRGGQTCNPYEGKVVTQYYEPGTTIMEATMQIEVPQIDVDVPIISDIPTGSAANYTLRLGNASEIGEDVTYKLFLLDETNPNTAQLILDGKTLTGEGRLIKVPGNQTLTKTLQLRQGDISILEYEGTNHEYSDLYGKGIGIVFASESQPEEIADTVFIKAFFTPSSSAVDLALSNTTMNTQTGTGLKLTFSNFDRNYHNLKAFRLQYKKQGSTDWTLLKEYVLNAADKNDNNEFLPSGAKVDYMLPMASFSDGNYLFRCVSASTHGTGEVYRYSDEIALVKDMQRPTPLGLPEPSDGILDAGDEVSVTFNETILKGELTKEANFLVTGVLNGAEVAHETALSMQNTETTAATEASITLSNKDFSADMWVYIQGAGTILTHGSGASKMTIAIDADDKLAVTLGGNTYVSTNVVPMNKWSFLTLNYQKNKTGGYLNASVASDADVDTLFSYRAVAAYEGVGPLSVGRHIKGAIHELLLWDEAHDLTTALLNRSKTKNPMTRHLIGYWKMNEGEGTTIRDYARNRHMTMPDETWYLNNDNKAVSLDGSHYIAINTSTLQTFEGDDYAVEFWMRGGKQTSETQLMQMGEVGLWTAGDGTLHLTGKGASKPANQMTTLTTSSGDILDNTWHHIALNTLRQGAAAVYVDGKRVLTTNAANVGSIASDKLLLGARRTTSIETEPEPGVTVIDSSYVHTFSHSFNGQVDEIRVWSASMNADRLAKQRKVRLTGSEDGLAAYYPFETKTLDKYNQVVTLGTDSCLTGSTVKAQLLTLNSEPSTLNYTDEAPALRAKPTETNVSFTYVASDTKVVVTIDENPATIEGCTLNFTVRDVRDENGNYSLPAIWSAFVNQNRLVWETDELTVEQPANSSTTVTATIQNNGGTMQSWTLNGIPSWMRASVTGGDTNPLAKTNVTFTVTESTPIGKYEETIYLTGTDGIEVPLTIRVTVKGEEPDWAVNEKDFESSMNIIGNLEILGVPSEDADDIVAAFIGDECRGVAHPEYISIFDAYFVTMDIYGNTDENNDDSGLEVTFKVYDASTGETYPIVQTSEPVAYEANSLKGDYDNPLLISALDMQEQQLALSKGWSWISLFVETKDMAVPVVLKELEGSISQIKNQINFMNYSGGRWSGKQMTLNNLTMYKVNMAEKKTISIIGSKVNPQEKPISLSTGWNWVAYNGSQTMSITDAFADMEPQDGDQVKGQSKFATYRGGIWLGTLKSVVPGQGYMIQSVTSRTFRYPKATATAGARMYQEYGESPVYFTPVDFQNYPSNMTVIAQVLSDGMPVSGVEVGVFAGKECRSAEVSDQDGYVFLTIPGDGQASLTFRVSDGQSETQCSEVLTYGNDECIGSVDAPFILNAVPTGINDVNADTAGNSLYDLQGRRVYRHTEGVQRSTLKKGVYIENGQKRVK
jgi:hypothetical protein